MSEESEESVGTEPNGPTDHSLELEKLDHERLSARR